MLDIFVFNFKEIMCTFLNLKKYKKHKLHISWNKDPWMFAECESRVSDYFYPANPTENICLLTSKSAFCSKQKAGHKSRSRSCCSNPESLHWLQLCLVVFWTGNWVGLRGWPHALCVSSEAKLIVNMECFTQCFDKPEKECNSLVKTHRAMNNVIVNIFGCIS